MKLTTVDVNVLEHADSLSAACHSLGKSENQTCKLARKAIKDARLSASSAFVWRGWLGMNGEVRESKLPPAGLPSSSFLPDEPPLAAPETPSAPAEQVFDVRQPRTPLPSKADVFKRLQRVPVGATYADIVQTYRDGRTLKDSHAALRRFVENHAAELPAHVVKLVAPKAVVTPPMDTAYPELAAKVMQQGEKLEQLAAIVQVLGLEMDLLTEEEEEEEREPQFSPVQLLWPAISAWSLTSTAFAGIIAVARRVPRAVERFVDIIRGKEW